jgi:hypothetical protein
LNVVGFKLGWTPITGYCDFINPATDCGGPMEASDEDYVRTAPAEGRAGARRDPLAHPAQRAPARRHAARDGHRPRNASRQEIQCSP